MKDPVCCNKLGGNREGEGKKQKEAYVNTLGVE